MMRLPPIEPQDAAEEEKRLKGLLVSNVVTFFFAVALIRLVPHVIKFVNE